MTSPRWSITHPLLTPELYESTPGGPLVRKVRALQIFEDRATSPEVVLDVPDEIIFEMFTGLYRCLHFASGFHMYISVFQGYHTLPQNVIATHLMRLHYAQDTGVWFPDTIYGDVVVFGSGHAYTGNYDNFDYSVPYEIVEEIIYLYEHI